MGNIKYKYYTFDIEYDFSIDVEKIGEIAEQVRKKALKDCPYNTKGYSLHSSNIDFEVVDSCGEGFLQLVLTFTPNSEED